MENKAPAEKKIKEGDSFKPKDDYKNAIRAYGQSHDLHTNMAALNGLAECLQKTSRASEDAYLATNLQNIRLTENRDVKNSELAKDIELLHSAEEMEDSEDEEAKNAEVADQYRKEGNTFFMKAQYAHAIDYYTKSIAINKTAVTLANRAQAYLNIGNAKLALDDAHAALELDDNNFKAWYRCGDGEALFQLGRIALALRAFEEALRNGPPAAVESKLCNERILECKKKTNSQKDIVDQKKEQIVTAKKEKKYV